MLTALNFIHGDSESLSIGKNLGAKMHLLPQRVCGFGIADRQTQRVPVAGYVRE